MNRRARTLFVSASSVALLVAAGHAQDPQRGRGGPPGAPATGRGAPPPLMRTAPRPLVANAAPVRSCESLAGVALPNTTIESAAVDPNTPSVCRVTAVTTHPPAGDQVRIWIAIPLSNWNGRFLGTGGGGSRAAAPPASISPRRSDSRPAPPTRDTKAPAAASRSMRAAA